MRKMPMLEEQRFLKQMWQLLQYLQIKLNVQLQSSESGKVVAVHLLLPELNHRGYHP